MNRVSAGLENVQIPLVGAFSDGDSVTAEENIIGYIDEVFEKPVPTGILFALCCAEEGLKIREQADVADNEIVAVLIDGSPQAALMRVKHQGGMVLLLPNNKESDPVILNQDHLGHIIGKAVQFTTAL